MKDHDKNLALVAIRPFNFCDRLIMLIMRVEMEIAGIRIEILELQEQLHHAPPPPKDVILAEIRELREVLKRKKEELEKLKSRYEPCIIMDEIFIP